MKEKMLNIIDNLIFSATGNLIIALLLPLTLLKKMGLNNYPKGIVLTFIGLMFIKVITYLSTEKDDNNIKVHFATLLLLLISAVSIITFYTFTN